MTAYILQAILFQLLFLLVYEFLLKKETFFSYNRWYLLITALASLLLPLIKIEALGIMVPAETFTGLPTIMLPEVYIGGEAAAGNLQGLSTGRETKGSAFSPWIIIYVLGFLISLLIVLKKYMNLNRMFRFKKIAAEGNFAIIEVPNSSIACTFYRTIFLGDQLSEDQKQQILSHELVHVRQKHSMDLVFFELLKVIFWFNPLIYIYQNRIATIHEFIADAAVVKVTEKKGYYEQLLNSAFNTQNISFINQFFNHSLIKKRIVMLQKTRSKSISKAKYVLLLPLMLLMLTIVACSDNVDPKMETTSEVIDEKIYLIKISDFENQTEEEQEKIKKAVEGLYWNSGYDRVRVTDGTRTLNIVQNKETGKQEIFIEKKETTTPVKTQGPDIPFAVVEQVPVFPGCENLSSNDDRKKCMTEKINEYVITNFNTGLGKELGLEGTNRVIAIFKISPDGNITDVRARAPHPDLEVEAKRIIEGLPTMKPGEHNGKKVAVSYSLPIVFQVNE